MISGMNAEPLHKFLQNTIKLDPFPLVRAFNWQKLFVTITTLAFLGILTKLAWPQVQRIVTNRNTWAVLSLVINLVLWGSYQVTILMFTSGHMFNTIRHTPYVQPNGRGGFNYFAGGFQNQFGIETQIIAAICTWLDVCWCWRQMDYLRSQQWRLSWRLLRWQILQLSLL